MDFLSVLRQLLEHADIVVGFAGEVVFLILRHAAGYGDGQVDDDLPVTI